MSGIGFTLIRFCGKVEISSSRLIMLVKYSITCDVDVIFMLHHILGGSIYVTKSISTKHLVIIDTTGRYFDC